MRSTPPFTPGDLRVQILSTRTLAELDRATSLRRALAPGLEQVLVAVVAGSEITVGPADLDALDLGEDQAWALGSDQALASDLDAVVATDFPVAGGGTLSLLASNGFFMSACVVRLLEAFEEEVTLVSLPTWHHAVLYRVHGPLTLEGVTLFADAVGKLERGVTVATAARLSPAVFAYGRRDRAFTELVLTRDDDGRVVAVAPDLARLVRA